MELDLAPQGGLRGDRQADPVRFFGRDQLGRPALHDLDGVIAARKRRPPAAAHVVHDLALCQHPEDVGVQVRQVHGRPRLAPSSAALHLEARAGDATLQTQRIRVGGTGGARDDVAATAELLKSQDAYRLLSKGAGVVGLDGAEQVLGQFPQPVGIHAPPPVFDRDDGALAAPP